VPAWLALGAPARAGAWLGLLAAPLAVSVVAQMRRVQGPALNPVLGRTALAELAFGLLISAGLLI
jgi:1,4-dihydroxy-2-naphthoate octaprenyltransferase